MKGPPGKDGLPGHPGQRGEVVSIFFSFLTNKVPFVFLLLAPQDSMFEY